MPDDNLHNRPLFGTLEKLLFIVAWIMLAVGRPHLLMQIGLLCFGLVLVMLNYNTALRHIKVLAFALPFVVIGSTGVMFEVGSQIENALWQRELLGWWFNITTSSLFKAKVLAVKALNGLLAIQYASKLYSYHEAITLAKWLRLPGVLIEMIVLSYRYLFGVKKSASDIVLAQKQRMGYHSFSNSIRSFSMMLSAVFVRSLHLSLNNYRALSVRAYTGELYLPYEWKKSSTIGYVLVVLFFVVFLALSFI